MVVNSPQVWNDTTFYNVDSVVCDKESREKAGRSAEADPDEQVYTCFVHGQKGSPEAMKGEYAMHGVTVEFEGGMPDSEAGDIMHHVGGECELHGQSNHKNNVGHLVCRETDDYDPDAGRY